METTTEIIEKYNRLIRAAESEIEKDIEKLTFPVTCDPQQGKDWVKEKVREYNMANEIYISQITVDNFKGIALDLAREILLKESDGIVYFISSICLRNKEQYIDYWRCIAMQKLNDL